MLRRLDPSAMVLIGRQDVEIFMPFQTLYWLLWLQRHRVPCGPNF